GVHGSGFGLFTSPQKVEAETLEALRSATAALSAKAPEEAAGYRDLVLGVGEHVAEAKGGVQPGETEAIEKIKEAVGLASCPAPEPSGLLPLCFNRPPFAVGSRSAPLAQWNRAEFPKTRVELQLLPSHERKRTPRRTPRREVVPCPGRGLARRFHQPGE